MFERHPPLPTPKHVSPLREQRVSCERHPPLLRRAQIGVRSAVLLTYPVLSSIMFDEPSRTVRERP